MSKAQKAALLLENFIRQDLGREGFVALHEPWFHGKEWEYLKDCLDSGWVSSVGSYVDRLEAMCAQACGTSHAIAVVNGTAALHVLLHALGVKPGDMVICPALSFVATANAISYCGARPIFIDADPLTLGISPKSLEDFLKNACVQRNGHTYDKQTGEVIAAIVPMHVFGHPVDMDQILKIAEEWGIAVVEDAAESLGSYYKGKPCGSLAQAGILSFNGNKLVTTGGGGMIVTNDSVLAKKLKHITTTARVGGGWEFDHDEMGFNYRLPNLNAALGCAQMEGLGEVLANKRALAQLYADLFANGPARYWQEQVWAQSNFWLNAIFFADKAERDEFLEITNAKGLQARPCWRLLPDLPMYKAETREEYSCARSIIERLVNIPSSPFLVLKGK